MRASYTSGTNRETKTPYLIKHDEGESKILINQQIAPPINGTFISLGSYNFSEGSNAHVIISNENTSACLLYTSPSPRD